MATVENSSSLEKTADVSKESNNESRETLAEFNNVQDGGHVVSSSSLQQNPLGVLVPTAPIAQVGEWNNPTFLLLLLRK